MKNQNTFQNARPCCIEGVVYLTVKRAAINFKVSSSTVKRRIESSNPKWDNWKWEKKPETVFTQKLTRPIRESHESKTKPRGVRYKNQTFSRIRACSKALGISTHKVITSCDNPKNSDFSWVSDSENILTNEVKSSLPQKVRVGDILYPSQTKASEAVGVTRTIIRRRCLSSDAKYKNWSFEE